MDDRAGVLATARIRCSATRGREAGYAAPSPLRPPCCGTRASAQVSAESAVEHPSDDRHVSAARHCFRRFEVEIGMRRVHPDSNALRIAENMPEHLEDPLEVGQSVLQR